jgi:C4-dicarboxylate-specific signal transduction histidine kinase
MVERLELVNPRAIRSANSWPATLSVAVVTPTVLGVLGVRLASIEIELFSLLGLGVALITGAVGGLVPGVTATAICLVIIDLRTAEPMGMIELAAISFLSFSASIVGEIAQTRRRGQGFEEAFRLKAAGNRQARAIRHRKGADRTTRSSARTRFHAAKQRFRADMSDGPGPTRPMPVSLPSDGDRLMRAAALGHFGAAILHELTQPLTSAGNFATAAKGMVEAGKTGNETAQAIECSIEQIQRAAKILRSMRFFLKAEPQDLEWVTLEDLIQEVEPLCKIALQEKSADLLTYIDPRIEFLRVNRIHIQQVILNIVFNASEAFDKQNVRIVWIVAKREQQDIIRIIITDTGCGISEAFKDRLFTAFSTTKESGLGMGLSISKRIIESHGGKIWFEPRQGGGASFHFTLRHFKSSDRLSDVS